MKNGRVGIFVKDNIRHGHLNVSLNSYGNTCELAAVFFDSKTVLVIGFYRPPNSNLDLFVKKMLYYCFVSSNEK